MRNSGFEIAVLPGDGIGVEVMEACLEVLDALAAGTGLGFAWRRVAGGAHAYKETGTAFSDESMRAAEAADAILFGAMGWPDIRYPDGREIAPQLDIREHLELFAGVRPIRPLPGLPSPLADPRAAEIDLVIIREQTEGLFFSRGEGKLVDDEYAEDTVRITRKGSERLFDFAFRLARQRRGRGGKNLVTVVDKANVLRSMAFMRKIFDERARANPDVAADRVYIDAAALNLVRHPWVYDVMVTENQFGDILSDLAAGLVGGMGMAPSADIGEGHALFQPCHGSAPDIAGTGKANPTAMFLSAALMLDWLGERHGEPRCGEAAARLRGAVDRSFASREVVPFEFGGSDGTAAVTKSVLQNLA
jgi:3-isopropylmalate dehydrogenase